MNAPLAADPAAPFSYDEVPYDSHPFAQTHPSRLFTVATLFGLRPTAVSRCRVLELGCAAGGNLLPMADLLPDSEFLGVDLSQKQIEDGQALASQFKLKNLTLRHGDIGGVTPADGMFDYVICHGVFSWVDPATQQKIFDICAKQLTPHGVAYVSYNTYPGWHLRGAIRDMMRYHSERFNTPQLKTQQSRALLDFLATSVKQDGGAYSVLLKSEVETLKNQADHYLYHEHLEQFNTPVYFHQFAEAAKKSGLKYLGESRIGTMVTGNFGPEIEKTLKMLATDQIMAEQYMDFLRNRMFRETLLCLDRAQPNWEVKPESLKVLHVASTAKPTTDAGEVKPLSAEECRVAGKQSFKSPSGMSMSTEVPLLKAAMKVLADHYPLTLPFESLRAESREVLGPQAGPAEEDAKTLAVGLLNCYMGSDLVELHGMPISFTLKPGDKPVAMPLVRALAPRTMMVPNRRHEVVRISDLDRQLLPLLDGTRDRTQLADELTDIAQRGLLNIQKDGQPLTDRAAIREAIGMVLDQALVNIAKLGIIVQ